jgi:RimJ/RimL family protein N-acetyltransferase
MLLGYAGSKIAVVTKFGFDVNAEDFIIDVVATGVNFRRNGYAYEAVERALETIEATRAEYKSDGEVLARIHERNDPSQLLFQKVGFERLYVADGDYATWIYGG